MDNIQILLRQHVGAPCAPCVRVGEHVQRGTLIAVPTGLGANLYASVSGTVEEITDEHIVLRPDDEQSDGFLPLTIPEGASKRDIVALAGIVGMGGAGFPTAVKLKCDLSDGWVLLNAAECEPGLVHNIRRIESQPQKLLSGVRHCMDITHAPRAIIAIKEKNEAAVRALREALGGESAITLHLLPDLYPMGEERAVVRECLGVSLRVDQLPSEAKAVVVNAETAFRIAEAIDEHRPCISKDVTVRGKLRGGSGEHVFFDVPIGTSAAALIERAGGIEGEYGEIIMGGAFTGRPVSPDEPITRTTGAVLVTDPLPDLTGEKLGLLVCACGGSEARMRGLAEKLHAEVACVCRCKQAVEPRPGAALKCERPGICPGQAGNNLKFKKAGCTHILIGNCSDCTNTVMASAPSMGLTVHHMTDHAMTAVGHALYRALPKAAPQPEEAKKEAREETQSVCIESGEFHIRIASGKNIEISLPVFGKSSNKKE